MKRQSNLPEDIATRLHNLSDMEQRGVLWFMIGWMPRNPEHFIQGITRAVEMSEDTQEKRNAD